MLDNILSILIFFPALAAIFGFVVHKDSMRAYGVSVSFIEFMLAMMLWFSFDSNVSGMQFMEQVALVPSFGINYILGVDGISLFIVILAAFFTMIGIASLSDTKNVKNMIITLLFLQISDSLVKSHILDLIWLNMSTFLEYLDGWFSNICSK